MLLDLHVVADVECSQEDIILEEGIEHIPVGVKRSRHGVRFAGQSGPERKEEPGKSQGTH